MYNVSFRVGDSQLASTLNRLQGVASTLEISHIPEASQRMSSAPSQPSKLVKVRRHKRTYKRRNGSQTDVDKVQALINSIGTGPFKSRELISKAENSGVPSPSVYRALRLAVQSGNLKRIEAGSYQRTAQSFAKSA